MPDITNIHKDMQVLASDGPLVGLVDKILGVEIVLCDQVLDADLPPTVPLSWVTSVNDSVHLARHSDEVHERTSATHRIR